MDRRAFIITVVGGSVLAAPLSAAAQQSAKVHRIGLLIGSSESFVAPYIAMFRQALRALGYVEGENIAVEYRYANGNYDRLPTLAADLVRLKVDIVVTEGTPPTRAAKQATTAIPIVMTVTGDPVAAGLVKNLARPGGNLTGALINVCSTQIADVAAKYRLPTIFGLTTFAEAGGLMAYGPNRPELWRRAATFVDKILKGAKPGDLPVEQPTRFDLVINVKTAQGFRLTIPPSVLVRADQLIE